MNKLRHALHLALILFVASGTLLSSCSEPKTFNAVQYADPQIGSVHGRWFFYTPAAVPFGMVKLAPHTNAYGSFGSWLPAGYDDRHESIEGFGNVHEFQIGGIVNMPMVGSLKTLPGSLENPDGGYRSRFDKATEYAEPGYYSVLLKDYNIKAELTATTRVGYHRYTYPASDEAHLLFDIGHKQGESSDVTEAYAALINDSEVEGYVVTYPEYVKFCDEGKRVAIYFYARLNKTPQAWGVFTDSLIVPGDTMTKGVNNGLYLTFSTEEGEEVEMKIAISFTSIEHAKLNLNSESEGVDFDLARKLSSRAWNDALSKIEITDSNINNLKKFYTGLYHALSGRGIANDVNGAYPLNDGGIGYLPLDAEGKPARSFFNTDGMWGAFWNLSQLWALVYPDHFMEYLQANLDFAKETGWLHDGLAAGIHTNGVQTNFFGLLIASAHNVGLEFEDLNHAWETAYKNETGYQERPFGSGKYDLRFMVNHGYIPDRDTILSNGWIFNFGGSHTLEYAFSSYAVAQMAFKLGKMNEYHRLMNQANGWKHLFDPETKYIRPRHEDGRWVDNFDPMQAWRGFQEGNAVQYTWYVPHDPAGLMQKLGPDLFNERLEETFTESSKSKFGGGEEIDSFSGVERLYNHGNQPSLHQSWLFNYSGKPWLTQRWTSRIMNEFYGTTPLHGYGYGQDEDQGQLGSWFVMAALGLFDVQGHTAANPTFQFGSPLFDRTLIHLPGGKKLEIVAINNSMENCYVQSLTFNGKEIKDAWIYRYKLVEGGTLKFVMGPEPNPEWGIQNSPPSMQTEHIPD